MKMSLNDTRGASAVEFAIILPVLLVILFGIIEFGFYIYNQQMLTNAAREGARAGIVATIPRPTPAQIETVVKESFQNAITFGAKNDVVLNLKNYNANAEFGDLPLEVTVSYQYSFLVFQNVLKLIGGDWLDQVQTIEATAVMRYE